MFTIIPLVSGTEVAILPVFHCFKGNVGHHKNTTRSKASESFLHEFVLPVFLQVVKGIP